MIFNIFLTAVGTVHAPRHDYVSSSAAILFLRDFLDPFDGHSYLNSLNHLNCHHNAIGKANAEVEVELKVKVEVKNDDHISEKDKLNNYYKNTNESKDEYKVAEREKTNEEGHRYATKDTGIFKNYSKDLSVNGLSEEHSINFSNVPSEERFRDSNHSEVRVPSSKHPLKDTDNNDRNYAIFYNDEKSNKRDNSNGNDKNENKDNECNIKNIESSYITTFTKRENQNINKEGIQDQKLHKRYLQLPACCTNSTNSSNDFSRDSSYQNIQNSIRIFGDKLRKMIFHSLIVNFINNDKDKKEHENVKKLNFSILMANMCLKKFIQNMNSREKFLVNKLLSLVHGHNLGLCTYPLSETTGWCEK